ncbi:RIP metalloprotease RseP [Pseudoduganella albidiflava]|uniref:Zinc metalloprotease n=1 Tax=Pseudoduganella albidiflava TaxID=321983 RepID=A0A411WWJ3_9BURK|nr:RIP metalloprotease RseP [Pseudoduganella albidiflava]QBI01161.1 RIP metalloprotease RseP [Pseudoduganella albidiflava]GGY48599.1 zinc metalloprotease [Pseudoduganella albidiflava]
MNLLQTVAAFLVALGTLVVIHELGHYLVARWCGVKVLRFSVGMGRVVWSRKIGPDQTEWAVSALPLGGYVKMLDARDQDVKDIPAADLPREFTRQNVWKRIAIVAAGPIANFLLAIVLFAGLYMVGIEEPATRIAAPGAQTPAALAGLDRDDVIRAVNGNAVAGWSELRWQLIEAVVASKDGEGARIEAERPGRGRFTFTVPAATLRAIDLDGDVPGELGFNIWLPAPVLGKVDPAGAGARAGLRGGDQVVAMDGKAVLDIGAFSAAIREAAARTVQLDVRRDGETMRVLVVPEAVAGKDGVTVGKIKVELLGRPDMIVVADGPFAAVAKAARKVWDTSVLTVRMIGRMIIGEVSWKNVTGPITIADYAGQSSRIGLASYLSFVAVVSISLGVMNLLPIPVLDGGHLLYYSLEVLTGRPVPERFGEIAQRLGVGLLVTLMALAVFNDVARLL